MDVAQDKVLDTKEIAFTRRLIVLEGVGMWGCCHSEHPILVMEPLGISNAVAPATLTFPMRYAIRIMGSRRAGGGPGDQLLPASLSALTPEAAVER
ncbi:hypothetical protein GGTG_03510 [Gaeumannomyces tritici R3-111a-1]|uniref:Uncharacterized protein n=1 Tax=Gaeumannomyces tritici (strain R3-111a-1) TaxID=644352 RepID=J3NQF3_GAET3|nr:hypothetical protein GGTG_03510 [Gaeumannomyces tritici R3-111a-1]EJT78409.1 hypothetical protein GGTG_03510 [Gaeumannomyces tritici R3-111a-1]